MGVFALRLGNDRYLPLLDLDRPARVTRLFTTLADGQRKAIFHFCFRQRAGGEWRPVGRIEWDELPPSRAGEPTLELRLIPGRAGVLLLRLRERTLGAARSYRLRLPVLPPEVGLEAPLEERPEAPPEPPRPETPPEPSPRRRLPEARSRSQSPPERRIRRRRLAIGLSLAAAALLAIGAVLALRLVPEARASSAAESPREPAPRPSPVPPAEPQGAPASADGVSGASPREPAPAAESAPAEKPAAPPAAKPAAPVGKPGPAAKPSAPPAAKPAAAAEPLSYRVQWGDTLWQITQQYYGNASLYSLLAGENAIVDPNRIISGTELQLPPRINDQDRKR